MENNRELEQVTCLNCGASVEGAFCRQCGQRVRDNLNRSMGPLLSEFLGNIFFFDNRFLLSIRYLFGYPGRMTVEFLEGKRKTFISPITLFLFVNLIYFFVSPLTDYSLSFYDQAYSQPHSALTRGLVEAKLKVVDHATYGATYQNMSDKISKSIMIVNIPIIALFIYLISFKQRRFYFDSLIFAFHYFSLFMISLIMLDWIGNLIDLLFDDEHSIFSNLRFYLFTLIVPLIYAILSFKKFMNIRWYWAIPAGIGAMAAVLLANFFYRLIIFVLTLWAT